MRDGGMGDGRWGDGGMGDGGMGEGDGVVAYTRTSRTSRIQNEKRFFIIFLIIVFLHEVL